MGIVEQFKLNKKERRPNKIERVWLYMLANKKEQFWYRKLKRIFHIWPDFYKNNVEFLLHKKKIKENILKNVEILNQIWNIENEKEKTFLMRYLGFKLKYSDGYFFTLFS